MAGRIMCQTKSAGLASLPRVWIPPLGKMSIQTAKR